MMRTKTRQSGLSLVEEVIVVAAVALLVVLSIPAVRALIRSIESDSGAKAMISAALSTARAVAAREQHYAGIRFQNKYQQDGKGGQYMIFIVHDPELPQDGIAGNLGCRAVEGLQPIKLPGSVGVMDLRKNYNVGLGDPITPSDFDDTTTFSVLFSPSGKLIIHELWVINKDGKINNNSSKDDIFNTKANVQYNKIGMFIQDGEDIALDTEPSRKSFIIYEKDIFEEVNEGTRYDDYLKDVEVIHINPYTGTIIEK